MEIFDYFHETGNLDLLDMEFNPFDRHEYNNRGFFHPFHQRHKLNYAIGFGYSCYQSSMAYALSDYLPGVVGYIESRIEKEDLNTTDFFLDILNFIYFRTMGNPSEKRLSLSYKDLFRLRGKKFKEYAMDQPVPLEEVAEYGSVLEQSISENDFLIADRSFHGELYDIDQNRIRRRVINHPTVHYWPVGEFSSWFKEFRENPEIAKYSGTGNWDLLIDDLNCFSKGFHWDTKFAGRDQFMALLKQVDLRKIVQKTIENQ